MFFRSQESIVLEAKGSYLIFFVVSHNLFKIRSIFAPKVKLISIFRFRYGYKASINSVSKLGSFDYKAGLKLGCFVTSKTF